MPPPSLGGGGSGGGRRGGPVGSFARTPFFAAASCSSSCACPQKHAVGPLLENRLSAPVIDNYTHYSTDHCQSSLESSRTLFTCHGWIRPEGTFVHPDEILRSRVTGQSTSGSASVFGFVTHGQSFQFRHTRTKPSVSIDGGPTTNDPLRAEVILPYPTHTAHL